MYLINNWMNSVKIGVRVCVRVRTHARSRLRVCWTSALTERKKKKKQMPLHIAIMPFQRWLACTSLWPHARSRSLSISRAHTFTCAWACRPHSPASLRLWHIAPCTQRQLFLFQLFKFILKPSKQLDINRWFGDTRHPMRIFLIVCISHFCALVAPQFRRRPHK